MGDSGTPNYGLWPVLGRLAQLDKDPKLQDGRFLDKKPDREAWLRRVLRPHDEAGFEAKDDQWMVEIRQQLDDALCDLTLIEIGYELGVRQELLPVETQNQLFVLFRSEAFLRYLSAYLYFGIASSPAVPNSQ